MQNEVLVHTCRMHIEGQDYEVAVYLRPGGRHAAKTVFHPNDIIINDGLSLEEALGRHQRLLPLAVNSRRMLRQFYGRF